MRRLLLLFTVACGGPAPQNVCEEAQQMFQACGVTVPLISNGPCAGLRLSAASCIRDHGQDCEEIAELTRRPDTCFDELVEPPMVEPSDPLFPEQPETFQGDTGR